MLEAGPGPAQQLREIWGHSHADRTLCSPGLQPLPRPGCLRPASQTRIRTEQNREQQPLGDPERQPATVDTALTVQRPKED